MNDQRTNVLIFTDSQEPSGVGKHIALLIEGLDKRLFNLHLVCPPSEGGYQIARQAMAAGAGYHPLTLRSEYGWGHYDYLLDLLHDLKIDVFHSHAGATWECYLGIIAAAEAGVRVITNTEHLPFVLQDPGEIDTKRQINSLLDALITVSDEARDTHVASGTIAPHKAEVIHNGINPRPFAGGSRAVARQSLGIDIHTPLAVIVGRLYEQKGHRYLLEAMPHVLNQLPGAGLLVVGDGPLEWELRALAHNLGVAERVWFYGKRGDIPTILRAADVLALPSLFEGLPLVAMEAMASGVPVVGTRVCGTSELIDQGKTGLLVDAYNPYMLGDALLTLLCNPERARQMGAAGYERLQAQFTAQRMAEQTGSLYQRLLKSADALKIKQASPVRTHWGRLQVSPAHAATPAI